MIVIPTWNSDNRPDSFTEMRILVVVSPFTRSVHFFKFAAVPLVTVSGRSALSSEKFVTFSVPDSANANPDIVPASVASTVSFDNVTSPSA